MRRRPAWFVLAFLLVNGVNVVDARALRQLTADPFALLPDVDRQFLHSSPVTFLLGAPLARLVGADVAFGLVIAAGFALLAYALRRFLLPLPSQRAETLCLVLLSTPLLLVLTRWMGKSDAFLVGFYLLLAADGAAPVARFLLAVAMVLCHREMATIVLVVHLLLHRRDLAPILAGLAIGHCLVLVYLFGMLPSPPQSRVGYAEGRASALLGAVALAPVAHLVFSLNWFWIFFLIHLRRSNDLFSAGVLIALFGVAAMAFDYTRVFVLCSLPIILQVGARLASEAERAPPLVRASPFPLLFLLQFQVEGAGQVHDWSWIR